MRLYNQLSDEEKEKIKIYLLLRGISNMRLQILIIVSIMFYIPGMIMLFANNMSLFMLGGLLVGMAIITLLFVLQLKEKDDKYLHLSLGIDALMENVFEIKKSDINDLKKVWKVMK